MNTIDRYYLENVNQLEKRNYREPNKKHDPELNENTVQSIWKRKSCLNLFHEPDANYIFAIRMVLIFILAQVVYDCNRVFEEIY